MYFIIATLQKLIPYYIATKNVEMHANMLILACINCLHLKHYITQTLKITLLNNTLIVLLKPTLYLSGHSCHILHNSACYILLGVAWEERKRPGNEANSPSQLSLNLMSSLYYHVHCLTCSHQAGPCQLQLQLQLTA